MNIQIIVSLNDGEEIFKQSADNFEMAEEVLGRAERYIHSREKNLALNDNEF